MKIENLIEFSKLESIGYLYESSFGEIMKKKVWSGFLRE